MVTMVSGGFVLFLYCFTITARHKIVLTGKENQQNRKRREFSAINQFLF
jgi:hypothetical protein